jgi:purine-cytosine permease-like protein
MTARGTAARREPAGGEGEGRTWRAASGAWLGIGTAPGALVLGAQVGGRHGGALPVAVLAAGGVVMTALLAAQGRLGLRPPAGEGAGMTVLAPRYLPPVAERAFTALLAVAMAGWFGFNVGLGGAALAALTGLPDAAGAVLLTVPIVAVLLAGGGRWNAIAVATTLTAIALIGIVAVRLPPPASPVSFARDGPFAGLAADLAGYIGYVSVFAVRAPDFTAGLRGRRDLAACVALLVGPALAASVVGAGVAAASGSTDVVAVLAGPDGLPAANLFVAASVIAPTFAAVHSGALAVRRFLPAGRGPDGPPGARVWGVLAVAVPGAVLAALRVDRMLLDWLTVLAAALPALVPPMAAEAARRRRGRPARPVRTWIWAPGAVLAVALTLAGHAAAAPVGLAVSAAATLVHAWSARARPASGIPIRLRIRS